MHTKLLQAAAITAILYLVMEINTPPANSFSATLLQQASQVSFLPEEF